MMKQGLLLLLFTSITAAESSLSNGFRRLGEDTADADGGPTSSTTAAELASTLVDTEPSNTVTTQPPPTKPIVGGNSCPAGLGCDVCPRGRIVDDSKIVTIFLPGLGGLDTNTCAEWFAAGCELVDLNQQCTEYQALLTECCSDSAGTEASIDRHGWFEKGDSVGDDEEIKLILGLAINFDAAAIDSIFDPNHENFRKFLTRDQAREMATEGLDTCREKLLKSAEDGNLDASSLTAFDEYFEIKGTAKDILALFEDESLVFKSFAHENSEQTIIRAVLSETGTDVGDLFIDDELGECIGVVLRLIDFPHVRRNRDPPEEDKGSPDDVECGPYTNEEPRVVPQTLFDMYGVPSTPVDTSKAADLANIMAVYEGDSTRVSQEDLDCYASTFSIKEADIAGGNAGLFLTDICLDNECFEPNLDVQLLSAVNQAVDIMYLGSDSFGDMLIDLIQLPDEELPLAVSISWSSQETTDWARSMQFNCREFAYLAARGVTFFAASGDRGATNESQCGPSYSVAFPASCPYVTAVGATTGFAAEEEVVAQVPNSGITSGGGFSFVYTPDTGFNLDFQSEYTSAYLDKATKSMPGFPTNGRGLPDISAPGTDYVMKQNYLNYIADGTSAACPVMAGITARIMLDNGGKRLGNINPLLYANQDIFFDIVVGQNSADSGENETCPEGATDSYMGFEALPGWDPASGVGTLGTASGAYSAYEAVLLGDATPGPDGYFQLKADPKGCLTVRQSEAKPDQKLRLGQCDLENQAWKYEDGMFMSKLKNDMCMQAGRGGTLKHGNKMRLYPCDKDKKRQQFEWNGQTTGIIKLQGTDLCVHYRGVNADIKDPMILKDCEKVNSLWTRVDE